MSATLSVAVLTITALFACATGGSNVAATVAPPPCNLALVRGMQPVADSLLPSRIITTAAHASDTLDATVYLVGDAGYPVQALKSVLAHVHSQVAAQAARNAAVARPATQWVAYLGDNAYPRGLPPESAADSARESTIAVDSVHIPTDMPDSAVDAALSAHGIANITVAGNANGTGNAERRARGYAGVPATLATERDSAVCALEQQVEAAPAPARVLFVPGNHDWRPAGCVKALDARIISCIRSLHSQDPAAVRREAEFLDAQANGRVIYRPRDGCPGPGELHVGARLLILPFDSEWMLRHGDNAPDSACGGITPDQVIDSLAAHVARAPRSDFVMLAAHHPMYSGGEHGNACGGPGGIAGTIFTDLRKIADIGEDFSGDAYTRMRKRLISELSSARRPLVYASGHDHTLQLFADTTSPGATYYLVSGAGSVGTHESSCVRWQPGMVYPFSTPSSERETPTGFMRLDVYRNSAVRLSIFTLSASGELSRSAEFTLQ